eukprot:scaffold241562_cov17-Tisochrysis_lutea.AAC.2
MSHFGGARLLSCRSASPQQRYNFKKTCHVSPKMKCLRHAHIFVTLRTLRHWTEAFAIPKNEDEVCMRMMEMGFSKEAAQRALKEANGDENIALEKLL